MEWERFKTTFPKGSSAQPTAVYRSKVPGGWLVLFHFGSGMAPPALFIPDADYNWSPELVK